MFHLVGNLSDHFPGERAVFLRIGEHAEPLEFHFANEIEQCLKAHLGFAGKTDDEGRPQRDAGNSDANFANQIHDVLLRGFAAHPFEHVFVDMLERKVHITRDFFAIGDGLDKFVRPMRRMCVKQANPEIAFERIQFTEQRANGRGIGGE